MNTTNFWPNNPLLATDKVVELLREQGDALPEVTDELLKAAVHLIHCKPDVEKIVYCIEPVNGFTHTILFNLLSFERPYGTEFPFTMTVFPLVKEHLYEVEIYDFETFRMELKKAMTHTLTRYMLKHKQQVVLGAKPQADDTFLYPGPNVPPRDGDVESM